MFVFILKFIFLCFALKSSLGWSFVNLPVTVLFCLCICESFKRGMGGRERFVTDDGLGGFY
jgi:hypothetical protein